MNHRQAHRSGRARLRFETLEPRHMLSATGDTFIAHENLFFPSSVEQQEMERVVGTDLTSLFVDYGKYQADTTLAASLAEYRTAYGRTLTAAYDQETARVALDIVAFESADAILDDLAHIGFEYVASIGRVASGWLPLDALDDLVSIEGVNFATSPSPAHTNVGIAESQGDATQQTSALRNWFGYTGAGITVGVISNSYDLDSYAISRPEDDVASGDLPGLTNPFGYTSEVNVLHDDVPFSRTDEGRAMLQIIHDVAPAASLAFSSFGSHEVAFQTQFANRIRELAKHVSEGGAGADVIVDDVTIEVAPKNWTT